LKFGDKTINIYHLEVPLYSNFSKKGFLIRLLDETGTFKNYDYYEYFDCFRLYSQRDNTFVIDMKIVPNYTHALYRDPPGASVIDLD
jgi:hypothetical protein